MDQRGPSGERGMDPDGSWVLRENEDSTVTSVWTIELEKSGGGNGLGGK